MSPFTIIGLIAILLLITGGIVKTLGFLLWIGMIMLVVSIIMYFIRGVSSGGR